MAQEDSNADTFESKVTNRSKVTLREARTFAAALTEDKIQTACGCYVCYSASCPSVCLGCPCFFNCCGACLWYNPFFCACPANSPGDSPGEWKCTDLKGITYWLVPVDEAGSLGWSSSDSCGVSGSDPSVACYCVKMC